MSIPVPPLPGSAEITARYGAAIATRDTAAMAALRAPGCVVDLVYRDAYGQNSSSLPPEEFYRSLFEAFREFDFEITRTLVATDAVFSEWTLRGASSGQIKPPLFAGKDMDAPPGRAMRLRGATLFDLAGNLIRREVIYFDYLSLVVELGVRD